MGQELEADTTEMWRAYILTEDKYRAVAVIMRPVLEAEHMEMLEVL